MNIEEKLIEAVRPWRELYDTKHSNYMKSKLKARIWQDIAKEINMKDDGCFYEGILQNNGDTDGILKIQEVRVYEGNKDSNNEVSVPENQKIATKENESEDGSWTDGETMLFLELFRTATDDYGLKFKKKNAMWLAISEQMVSSGYPRNSIQCRNRWNTLNRGYKRIIDHNRKTGRNRVTKSKTRIAVSEAVKKKLDELLGSKDSVQLQHLFNPQNECNYEKAMQAVQNELIETETESQQSHSRMETSDRPEDDLSDIDDPVSTDTPLQTASEKGTASPSCSTSSTPVITKLSIRKKKPTLVGELKQLREQQKLLSEHKQQILMDRNETIKLVKNELQRSNDLLEEHNNILKAILQKM